jgi:hypothetical protein
VQVDGLGHGLLGGRLVGDVGGDRVRGAARGLDAGDEFVRRSLRRATTTTLAPSEASSAAVAWPMPLEAPVTSATQPESLSAIVLPLGRTRIDSGIRIDSSDPTERNARSPG